MQKPNEHKIEDTLKSLNGIKRAEANAYTFEKVMARLHEEKLPVIGIRWTWVAAMLMVIMVNTSVVFYSTRTGTSNATNKETYYNELGNEMGYTNGYNY